MPSAKASRVTPNNDPVLVEERKAKGWYCESCDRTFSNLGGKKSHDKLKHAPAPLVRETEPVVGSSPVLFHSPRAPEMRLIIKPEYRSLVSGPSGERWRKQKGLTIQFKQGRFATSDPKIIAYLEGDERAARLAGLLDEDGEPMVYKDLRFPIISQRKMQAEARQHLDL